MVLINELDLNKIFLEAETYVTSGGHLWKVELINNVAVKLRIFLYIQYII